MLYCIYQDGVVVWLAGANRTACFGEKALSKQRKTQMKNIAKSIAAFLVLLSVLVSTGCATTVYRGTSTEHITRIASGEVPKIGQRVIIHYSMYYEESDGPGKKVIVWEGYDDRKIHVFTTIGPAFGITDDDKGVEGALVKDPEVGAVFAKIKTE